MAGLDGLKLSTFCVIHSSLILRKSGRSSDSCKRCLRLPPLRRPLRKLRPAHVRVMNKAKMATFSTLLHIVWKGSVTKCEVPYHTIFNNDCFLSILQYHFDNCFIGF